MASSIEEEHSLKGSVLFHPSTVTPHDYPIFLRASVCRVVAGSMLLSGVFTAVCALVPTSNAGQTSCALSAAVSFVAMWHYAKLMTIREQSGTRLTLSKPGQVPMGQAVQLKIGWQDMAADAVRYSDWMVTLPALLIELHLIISDVDPYWFGIPWGVILLVAMVALGAYTRFGTDELVPIRKDQRNSLLDGFARLTGLLAYLLACVCLFFVLHNLLANVTTTTDPTNGWVYSFSLPWIAYGVVPVIASLVRQFYPNGYPESLSVSKDVAYGALDIWSKAIFGIWVGFKAVGLTDPVIAF